MVVTHLFLDIETFSPGQRPSFNDKIIAIAYKVKGSDVSILKEWESNEFTILQKFLGVFESLRRPSIVGHNVLLFDIPHIICRTFFHRIFPVGESMDLLLNNYPIDTIQVQLQSNNFNFKGLRLEDCARRIGLTKMGCPSHDISKYYKEMRFEKIIEHVTEDVRYTEKLFNVLKSTSSLDSMPIYLGESKR